VKTKLEGDAVFPKIDLEDWIEVSRESHASDLKNLYDFDFVLYERK